MTARRNRAGSTDAGWLICLMLAMVMLGAFCGYDAGHKEGQCTARCSPQEGVRNREECWCADGRRFQIIKLGEKQ